MESQFLPSTQWIQRSIYEIDHDYNHLEHQNKNGCLYCNVICVLAAIYYPSAIVIIFYLPLPFNQSTSDPDMELPGTQKSWNGLHISVQPGWCRPPFG